MKAIWLSDHRQIEKLIVNDVEIYEHKWVAAINSSLGSKCCLRGAALAFEITRNEFTPSWNTWQCRWLSG